jgi:hypothetical protein
LIDDSIGGKSIKPYQPTGYYQHLNFPPREYSPDTDQNQWRRGVYVHWQRQFLHPTLKALDAPSREECTAQRPRSNTPLAALALLNDPSFVEAARVFAERILREAGAEENDTAQAFQTRLDWAYEIALSRKPEPAERDVLNNLYSANRLKFSADPAAAEKLVSIGLAPVATELDAVELAAWTMISRAILNTNESMTRN